MKESDQAQRIERSRLRGQLMCRLQQGNAEACQALLDDVGPSLTYFLKRYLKDSDEVEDAYQEVFAAIFEARHTYEPGRPFEPWLFAIARNIAVDFTRRRWTRARWEKLVAEPPDRPSEATDTVIPDLQAVLAKLPHDQREAFAMLKLEGLSLEAAAARAGISLGALKVRAHRAYLALRKLVAG